jgi:hypothetical protein
MLKSYIVLISMVFLVFGCNKNLTEEEKKELWSKAQTTGEIINRSGTVFNSAVDKKLAMDDAQNRLITGGGLFGKKASLNLFGSENNSQQTSVEMGLPINPFLWRASIETISFMPLASTDPFAGTIITDWYTAENSLGQRCKLNIFINGADMKTDNLKVSSFCQFIKDNQWVNSPSNSEDNIRLENAILNKAKKLKLTSG